LRVAETFDGMRTFHLLVCLFPVLVSAVADEPRDGSWWKTMNQEQKHLYILGYFDGQAGAARLVQMSQGTKFALDYSNFEKRFEKLDNWQITSGVDQLYEADFRNLTISLADAVWLVSMAAMGEPTERIQAQLAELRKVYAPR
jgi:hypothetical protein